MIYTLALLVGFVFLLGFVAVQSWRAEYWKANSHGWRAITERVWAKEDAELQRRYRDSN